MVPVWLHQGAARQHGGLCPDWATSSLFGADYLGRDLLSRMIYGARVSLPVGFMGAFTALLIGLVYGSDLGLLWRQASTIS